jgi:hypothetical protein
MKKETLEDASIVDILKAVMAKLSIERVKEVVEELGGIKSVIDSLKAELLDSDCNGTTIKRASARTLLNFLVEIYKPSWIKDPVIRVEKDLKLRRNNIFIDGENFAHFEFDYHDSGDGWYSCLRIAYSETDTFYTDIRRASGGVAAFKNELLLKVSKDGHFIIGNFDTKKYISQ